MRDNISTSQFEFRLVSQMRGISARFRIFVDYHASSQWLGVNRNTDYTIEDVHQSHKYKKRQCCSLNYQGNNEKGSSSFPFCSPRDILITVLLNVLLKLLREKVANLKSNGIFTCTHSQSVHLRIEDA